MFTRYAPKLMCQYRDTMKVSVNHSPLRGKWPRGTALVLSTLDIWGVIVRPRQLRDALPRNCSTPIGLAVLDGSAVSMTARGN